MYLWTLCLLCGCTPAGSSERFSTKGIPDVDVFTYRFGNGWFGDAWSLTLDASNQVYVHHECNTVAWKNTVTLRRGEAVQEAISFHKGLSRAGTYAVLARHGSAPGSQDIPGCNQFFRNRKQVFDFVSKRPFKSISKRFMNSELLGEGPRADLRDYTSRLQTILSNLDSQIPSATRRSEFETQSSFPLHVLTYRDDVSYLTCTGALLDVKLPAPYTWAAVTAAGCLTAVEGSEGDMYWPLRVGVGELRVDSTVSAQLAMVHSGRDPNQSPIWGEEDLESGVHGMLLLMGTVPLPNERLAQKVRLPLFSPATDYSRHGVAGFGSPSTGMPSVAALDAVYDDEDVWQGTSRSTWDVEDRGSVMLSGQNELLGVVTHGSVDVGRVTQLIQSRISLSSMASNMDFVSCALDHGPNLAVERGEFHVDLGTCPGRVANTLVAPLPAGAREVELGNLVIWIYPWEPSECDVENAPPDTRTLTRRVTWAAREQISNRNIQEPMGSLRVVAQIPLDERHLHIQGGNFGQFYAIQKGLDFNVQELCPSKTKKCERKDEWTDCPCHEVELWRAMDNVATVLGADALRLDLSSTGPISLNIDELINLRNTLMRY